ncbi:hypothetical protein ACFVFI_07145 [Streptomyces sp. NPDC057705]|uniref:hypothetical protein n=1 Tax=Streptomyces sp. NPDC057705 TaxID=3346222 RepID=UPI0036AE0A62
MGLWAHLVLPAETSPLPASGGLPEGVLGDDHCLPVRPWRPFLPHSRAFSPTLVRLPAVRRPALRAHYERYGRPY